MIELFLYMELKARLADIKASVPNGSIVTREHAQILDLADMLEVIIDVLHKED